MAMWSSKRWSPEAIAARKAAEAGVAYIPPVVHAVPPPPPPPRLVTPVDVETKWMGQFGTKKFYFTAKGLKAAQDKTMAFFRTTSDFEVTWLGAV
jgi:hypothetical protein